MRFQDYCNMCQHSGVSPNNEPCSKCISESATLATNKAEECLENGEDYFKNVIQPSRYLEVKDENTK